MGRKIPQNDHQSGECRGKLEFQKWGTRHMFSSNVLEVGVGLVFTFLTVSLITSAIIEMITSVTGWRSRTLLHGIQRLLNDTALDGLAQKIYKHAAVNPRADGSDIKNWSFWKNWNLPAYVDKS